jgi:hypothetical protein
MAQLVDKTVKLRLIGVDANAFSLMGAFQCQARKEGWSKKEIDTVINEATSGDYDHLLRTLSAHCRECDQ